MCLLPLYVPAAPATGTLHLDYECLLPPCAALGVYQPSSAGTQWVATAGYYYIVQTLGLAAWGDAWTGPHGEIARAGRRFCELGWDEVPEPRGYAWDKCFGSACAPHACALACSHSAQNVPSRSRPCNWCVAMRRTA